MNYNKLAFIWRRGVSVGLVLLMVLGLVACGSEEQEPLRAPVDVPAVADVTVSIETAYGTLGFPEELLDNMRHMEVMENGTAMEVFYMVTQNGEKEVFRICYADSRAGTLLGYLTTDNGEIPVSYTLCEYADGDFADEEERKLYYSMMDSFSVVMNSIHADERFSEQRLVEPMGDREVKLRYWKVVLPENVQYAETEENGNYRVDFYGELSGEKIDLYMIGLGDLEGESMLGLYNVKGEQKPVMVGTYNLDEYDSWPEEEKNVIYEMMASINKVIQTIVADEYFVEAEPGA